MLAQMLIELAKVDAWLDDAVSDDYKAQPLAQDWARITKVAEELGEATDAFILYTGQNPRKPRIGTIDDTVAELADVAITAILAIQHFTKDESQTGALLLDKVRHICQRMVNAKRQAKLAAIANTPEARAAQYQFVVVSGQE